MITQQNPKNFLAHAPEAVLVDADEGPRRQAAVRQRARVGAAAATQRVQHLPKTPKKP